MLKKILLILMLGCMAMDSYAVRIINQNSRSVEYSINDGTFCMAEYTKGEISKAGEVVWTQQTYYHPETVCVHVAGWTSSSGEFAYNIKNDTCVLVVKDAGFGRGIKIERHPGC